MFRGCLHTRGLPPDSALLWAQWPPSTCSRQLKLSVASFASVPCNWDIWHVWARSSMPGSGAVGTRLNSFCSQPPFLEPVVWGTTSYKVERNLGAGGAGSRVRHVRTTGNPMDVDYPWRGMPFSLWALQNKKPKKKIHQEKGNLSQLISHKIMPVFQRTWKLVQTGSLW